MRLVSELRRRNVLRMAALYVVAAWLIVQVAGVLIDLAKLPDWIGTTILWLLAVGFPIALIFSWFYELTPEGLSLEKDVDRSESITHVTSRRLDFIVISLLCAAVILFAYDKWWIGPPPENSIAVLAFSNMTHDPVQEYFSDGISEELLNLLAKIPELRVISRTSAFSYKDKKVRLAQIAEELNVAHILEGSVRKTGDRVRITAQLIETSTDTHLWSETFDRSLDDVFAIQDEIAEQVVEQLKIAILAPLPKARVVDPKAHSLYLQAKHLGGQFTKESLEKSVALYEQALAIDSEYLPAWDGLASSYWNQANMRLRSYEESVILIRQVTEAALAIDANHAFAHGSLGFIATFYDGDLPIAAEHFDRALALDPTDPNILQDAAALAKIMGRLDEAIEILEYVASRDPVSAAIHNNLGTAYLYSDRLDEAIDSYRTVLNLSPGKSGTHAFMAIAMMLLGKPQEAFEEIELEPLGVWRTIVLPMIYHDLGQSVESDDALAALIEEWGADAAYEIAYILAYREEADRAFRWLGKEAEVGSPSFAEILGFPLFANIHNDRRWLPFLESIGKSPEQLDPIRFDVNLPK
jgi:TolB-like protein/Tfp pilus assembly protein PilF